ncbi:double zinc ribbon domain-containing protein [Pochonia chlamydosporia 170]|uniref:Double zinc ribbon domain-containing protein n=1 Tax=Pochonia chlamydosporia 170 TaxID=1380566 RepID=A0A179FM73_METCM|nr:double zinc ribbon domain-containing protein [Pochonia chlamydosporia 170]OAQ66340.1 double zinc ribbon domain-containing protein [Pochonia chlamydosporia 170]
MAYEMTPQGQTVVQQQYATARRGMSRWWPVSFFIAAVIFFIIGGGLMGAWAASYDSWDGYYNNGNWYGAIACFVIASLLKLTAWILLIIWCVKGRRTQSSTTVTYVNVPPVNNTYTNVPLQAPQQQYAPQPYGAEPIKSATPAPVYQNVETVPMQYGETARYCGNCGTAATTPFCAHCGGKVF